MPAAGKLYDAQKVIRPALGRGVEAWTDQVGLEFEEKTGCRWTSFTSDGLRAIDRLAQILTECPRACSGGEGVSVTPKPALEPATSAPLLLLPASGSGPGERSKVAAAGQSATSPPPAPLSEAERGEGGPTALPAPRRLKYHIC